MLAYHWFFYILKKFNVIGFDKDTQKLKDLKKGKSYLSHISDQYLKNALKWNFRTSSNFKLINETDIIILCLPTPLTSTLKPDLSYIKNTLTNILPNLKKGQLIILESSTYPGSTREIISDRLKKNKFNIGKNFFVGYSPEREDPSNKKFTIENIPKICSGISKNCTQLTKIIYSKIINKIVLVKILRLQNLQKFLKILLEV